MNYEKVDLAKFTANLSGGRYEAIAGARRAIGKMDWPEKDKAAAPKNTRSA